MRRRNGAVAAACSLQNHNLWRAMTWSSGAREDLLVRVIRHPPLNGPKWTGICGSRVTCLGGDTDNWYATTHAKSLKTKHDDVALFSSS